MLYAAYNKLQLVLFLTNKCVAIKPNKLRTPYYPGLYEPHRGGVGAYHSRDVGLITDALPGA